MIRSAESWFFVDLIKMDRNRRSFLSIDSWSAYFVTSSPYLEMKRVNLQKLSMNESTLFKGILLPFSVMSLNLVRNIWLLTEKLGLILVAAVYEILTRELKIAIETLPLMSWSHIAILIRTLRRVYFWRDVSPYNCLYIWMYGPMARPAESQVFLSTDMMSSRILSKTT